MCFYVVCLLCELSLSLLLILSLPSLLLLLSLYCLLLQAGGSKRRPAQPALPAIRIAATTNIHNLSDNDTSHNNHSSARPSPVSV